MRIVILSLSALLLSGCAAPVTCPKSGPTAPATPATPLPAMPPSNVAATSNDASPFAGRSLHASPADLAAFNAWAERAALGENLTALVALGRPLTPEAKKLSVQIDYDGESRMGATVTVIEDGYLDDSIRGERSIWRFERQSCAECPAGKSPWRLKSLDATQRCWPERGHQEFSSERCS